MIDAPKYQFIQFTAVSDEAGCDCGFVLPVMDKYDVGFQIRISGTDLTGYTMRVTIISVAGTTLHEETVTDGDFSDGATVAVLLSDYEDLILENVLAKGDCFRIGVSFVYGNYSEKVRSNMLQYIGCEEAAQKEPDSEKNMLFEYSCNEAAFDFDFPNSEKNIAVRLPANTRMPEFKTDEERYEYSDGTTKTLSAKIAKTVELETDYMSEDWHEKLLIALSCDHLAVDGVNMFRAEKYDMDKDYITSDCGEKLYRATTTLQYNMALRNSNCA